MDQNYYFTISRKRGSVEILVRSSIFSKFHSKWNLKWLPPDKGYFKFCFHKSESILIISCHTYLGTHKFIILFQVIFVLPCILFSSKCPVIWVLLINNPSKRGDVEILARSSISPSSQVKVKLKLTASR